TTSVFLGFYQLFTHSRVIGKLGFIEKFMTTPSHHRVHHARNEKYMDQNYAHIFIFWDRLFGTFVEEKEEPDYGITSGFESANAFNATFSYWRNLIKRANQTKSIRDKINVFIKGPEWTPTDADHLPNQFKTDVNGDRIPHKIPINNEKRAYLLFNILITACSFVSLLYFKSVLGKDISLFELISNKSVISLVGIILISVFAHSRIIEDKKFAILIDGIRLGSVISLTIFGFSSFAISNWLIPLVTIYSALMFLWLLKINMKPLRKVLRA
ncbi:MAG: sterol desaturase family protein, partial [Flavobacteriales bacterium]|nr:sterol desaturase family protein [Flavobacteriales bacterium]